MTSNHAGWQCENPKFRNKINAFRKMNNPTGYTAATHSLRWITTL